MRRPLILALCIALSLSGCAAPASGAYNFAAQVVDLGEARVPGHVGHLEAAALLLDMMDAPGWTTSMQSFNGSTYQGHPPGGAAPWVTRCGADDAAEVPDLMFHNLIATTGPADPILWLAAHWDAKEDASDGGYVPSANDGASGVGVLLHLMRNMPTLPFGVGIVFLDGEDGFEDCHPLAGSVHFANTMEPGLVDALILLDMVGDSDAQFIREQGSVSVAPELVDLVWEHGNRYAPNAFTDISRAITDDHTPFVERGIPAVDIIDAGRATTFPPYWHTSQDTMDKISPVMLDAVEKTLRATLLDERLPGLL